ncbi:MAG: CRISPR-associated primase-polymerase type B [Saprospiraceae bacterium]
MATFFSTGISVLNNSAMTSMTMEDIWQRLRNDVRLRQDVEHLRKVKRLDTNSYSRLKVSLPFFCCASFNEGMRNSKNFISVSSFVVDIDKYSGETAKLEALRERIRQDDRVALCFISPSGDGMKVVFTLAEPCTDLKSYSDFYKSFVMLWAQQMDLAQYVDLSTSDATRACFLSSDAAAFINPMAEAVFMDQYVPNVELLNFSNDSFMTLTNNGANEADVLAQPAVEKVSETRHFEADANCSHHIQPDAYAQVLSTLKTKARPNPLQRETAVPEPLVRLMPVLEKSLLQKGIQLLVVRDVQFGKQVQMQCGMDLAEINIYYGKKGFSVVMTTKKGTHSGFCALCAHIAEQTIYALYSEAYQVGDPSLN